MKDATHRELLEWASIAANMRTGGWALDQTKGMRLQDEYGDFLRFWNPIDDDGDALRLAVHLLLDITKAINWYFTDEEYEKDPYAATRLAIVMTAACLARYP